MNEWISIKERLPESHDDMLLRDGEDTYYIGWWRKDAESWDSYEHGWIRANITHWMPLPEPPKD